MWEQICFHIYNGVDIPSTSNKVVNLECEGPASQWLKNCPTFSAQVVFFHVGRKGKHYTSDSLMFVLLGSVGQVEEVVGEGGE